MVLSTREPIRPDLLAFVLIVGTMFAAVVAAYVMNRRLTAGKGIDWPPAEEIEAANEALRKMLTARLYPARKAPREPGPCADPPPSLCWPEERSRTAPTDRDPVREGLKTPSQAPISRSQLDAIANRASADPGRLTPGRLRDILTENVASGDGDVARLKPAFTGLVPSQVVALAEEIGLPITRLEVRLEDLGIILRTKP